MDLVIAPPRAVVAARLTSLFFPFLATPWLMEFQGWPGIRAIIAHKTAAATQDPSPQLCQARGSILCPSAPKMLLMPLRHSGSLLSSISCAGEKTFTGQGLAVPPEGTWENLDQPPTVLFILCTLAPPPRLQVQEAFQ